MNSINFSFFNNFSLLSFLSFEISDKINLLIISFFDKILKNSIELSLLNIEKILSSLFLSKDKIFALDCLINYPF